MRPKGSATELEARRRRAAECFQRGESLRTVADRFGVNQSSVKRWKRAWREGGVEALSAKPHPGGVSKLTIDQRDELVDLVVAGPLAAGFKSDLWTCERIATVVRRQFGVAGDISRGCCTSWASVPRSRGSWPASKTRKPSRGGTARTGRVSKKGAPTRRKPCLSR